MAALESSQFVPFTFPLSNPPFYNRNPPWSSKPSRSNRSLNASGSQKTHRPAATFSHSRYQIEAGRGTAAGAEDRGDDGWTDENMAELEKELGLALEEEQVKSPFAGAPTSPSPVEAPQEIQSRERSETTGQNVRVEQWVEGWNGRERMCRGEVVKTDAQARLGFS